MRQLRRIALGLLAGLALVASPAGAAPRIELTEAGDARFPDRAFVLTASTDRVVSGRDVEVFENGAPVAGVSVTSAALAETRELGVVLVIDASRSMKGAPIRSAMAAARRFAAQRNPQQPVAVVTFNSTSTVLLPLTADAGRIDRALASAPPLGRETHVYDATARAVQLLEAAEISAGSVVVLSDGDDTGSAVGAGQAAAMARDAGARVFTVGLRSGAFVPDALGALADSAGGTYSDARSPRELGEIFDELGARLANEYLVRYRSLAGPGEEIAVEARVEGLGSASTGYRTPALAIEPTPPFERSAARTFWQSPLAALIISALAAIPLALLALAGLRPRIGNLRARLGAFVSDSSGEDEARPLAEQAVGGAERSLERAGWWNEFKQNVELARIEMSPIRILIWTVAGTIAALWIVVVLLGQVILVPLAAGVPWGVRAFVDRKLAAQRAEFSEQLVDNLQVLASAIRAGHSLVGAMSVVVKEAAEPSKTEFDRVITDEQLGVPLEESLLEVAERMDNRDLEQVAVVASLQRETGGNTAEVLDRVSATVRARFELRRMVETLTAQGRLARWVVTALPIVLVVAITLMRPDYMAPLYDTVLGNALLALAAAMVVAGSLLIKRIVDIEL